MSQRPAAGQIFETDLKSWDEVSQRPPAGQICQKATFKSWDEVSRRPPAGQIFQTRHRFCDISS